MLWVLIMWNGVFFISDDNRTCSVLSLAYSSMDRKISSSLSSSSSLQLSSSSSSWWWSSSWSSTLYNKQLYNKFHVKSNDSWNCLQNQLFFRDILSQFVCDDGDRCDTSCCYDKGEAPYLRCSRQHHHADKTPPLFYLFINFFIYSPRISMEFISALSLSNWCRRWSEGNVY